MVGRSFEKPTESSLDLPSARHVTDGGGHEEGSLLGLDGAEADLGRGYVAAERFGIAPLQRAEERTEAADVIIASMEKSILQKRVTYDFARLMEGATQVSCSGFGQVLIENM